MLRKRARFGVFSASEGKSRHRKNKNIEPRTKRALNKVPHLNPLPLGEGKGSHTETALLRVFFFSLFRLLEAGDRRTIVAGAFKELWIARIPMTRPMSMLPESPRKIEAGGRL